MREFKYIWPLNHKNDFIFNSSSRDFFVEEIPLYEFSGNGEHLILKIRKKNLTTWEMLDIISNYLGIKKREIGYAGLKDKNAITIQYISLPKKYEKRIDSLNFKDIKILEKNYHINKIRIGHLKGNRFWLRFKKVLGVNKDKIESVIEWIKINGMPNYFGVQRFGNSGLNYLEGKDIVEGKLKLRDKKKQEFLISSYQSFLFNSWLIKRIEISNLLENLNEIDTELALNLPKGVLEYTKKQKNYFKLLKGDLYMHYPYGKIFYEKLEVASERFFKKDISPTGLIGGKKVKLAKDLAFELEKEYNIKINQNGSRRYAWIFPDIINQKYNYKESWYELEFYLPKGSYATILVDFLKGNN